ncbi:MAG TPA: hypothetical protein VFO46_22660 [Candidatus Sulfotelmatobacter sp.]|nr:hypothetical protein [Candidatus Sulfotelmatobacter sp.]
MHSSAGTAPLRSARLLSISPRITAAESGGADSHGTIFNLVPLSNGSWGLHVLHNFTGGSDAASPLAGVTLNSFGIFDTASAGGSNGSSVAFGIKP